MNTVLKFSPGQHIAASDAARHERQQRRALYPRSRTGCRYLTEPEVWEYFDAVDRARQRRVSK